MTVERNRVAELEVHAKTVRRKIIDIIYRTGSPHIGSSFSAVEILVALYYDLLRISPETVNNPNRDRFILSKGHACTALFTVLAERGYFEKGDLDACSVDNGIFEQHPNMDLGRGIEMSTGSLGHGLSVGAGMALAARIDGSAYNVYVLMSDGELNEGSVWEAVMFAGHHRLFNLAAFVDANKMQALGCTKDIIDLEPLVNKWEAFRWQVQEIDGHDFEQIHNCFKAFSKERPNAVILHTIKGKGVSFMENNLLWHYRTPDDEEYETALTELS